ncbi:hypothetical protein [Paenibacillus sp. N3.4]|uniref:hypothetical protein n=1 Tax=Paenibacillus sp. N3.4 TaxID=2603222 RepID=UPI0011C8C040|nr:hypothetical protein [Paenibacillus sp. N3.4]TXK74555.1 hypothetical protein FU659_28955 [Paenibacillus sp. N3.4]
MGIIRIRGDPTKEVCENFHHIKIGGKNMSVVKVETVKNNKKKITYYYVFEAKDINGKRVTYKK